MCVIIRVGDFYIIIPLVFLISTVTHDPPHSIVHKLEERIVQVGQSPTAANEEKELFAKEKHLLSRYSIRATRMTCEGKLRRVGCFFM